MPAPVAARPAFARPEPVPLGAGALHAEATLSAAGHEPPLDADLDAEPADLEALRAHGRVERLGRTMHIHADALAEVQRRVVAVIERDGSITIASLRDELQTSRRYAQALLELLDAQRVTLRVGDERVLRRRGSA